jgi:hypothetical protein
MAVHRGPASADDLDNFAHRCSCGRNRLGVRELGRGEYSWLAPIYDPNFDEPRPTQDSLYTSHSPGIHHRTRLAGIAALADGFGAIPPSVGSCQPQVFG